MARSDGSDIVQTKRQRLLNLQDALKRAYPTKLPADTLLFRCDHCGKTRPLNHFARNDQRYYGIRPVCRACRRVTRPKEQHEPDPSIIEKYCRHCHTKKSITEFWINRGQPDGYSIWCSSCARARRTELSTDRHYNSALIARREHTLKLCGELGIDYPGYDIMRCLSCNKIKPVNEFINDWSYVSRKKSICRNCHHS